MASSIVQHLHCQVALTHAKCLHSTDTSKLVCALRVRLSLHSLLSTGIFVLLQWWEKLLVNLTVLGVVLLILYGAFNQAVKVPAILNSFIM